MYQNIFYAIIVLFFAVGVITVITYLLLRAVSPDGSGKFYVVTVFSHKDRDCAVRISCVQSILTFTGFAGKCRIVAADSGLSKEERNTLNTAFSRDPNVIICDIEELCDIVGQ